MKIVLTVLSALALASVAGAQDKQPANTWEPFEYFLGEWEGTGKGNNTTSRVRTEFALVLDGQFVQVSNHSVTEPAEGESEGDVHEDVGYISYDKSRDTYVFRQFHAEGFVNQYVLESVAPDGKRIVFVTESIEGISAGWRARTTYHIDNDNEFHVLFDLASPEKEFSTCQQAWLTRRQE